jgi:RNA polymerase sigma factor (TIGR02999 family)
VDLTTTLYGRLRRLAHAQLAGQPGDQTLQATALVHEAWLRLGGDEQPKWNDQTHFFATVAETMRHILVDRARRRQCLRHGGGQQRVDLEAWNWERLTPAHAERHDRALLIVDEALEEFENAHPNSTRLVKLHFFAGLTIREAAEAVGLSLRTAHRRLAFAELWLGRQIRKNRSA